MAKGNLVETIDASVVKEAQPAAPVEVKQPMVEITLQELAYLYQVFVGSNIPGNDVEFAAELKRKLKLVLNIPQ